MKQTNIRDARSADIPALAALSAATFTENFERLYTKDNLAGFLASHHSEDYYARAYAESSVRLLVAEQNDALIGYAKIGPNTLPCDPRRPHAAELSRLYILKSHTGQTVGHDLMTEIFGYVRRQGYADILLSVFSENAGAQKFYHRYGFSKIADYKFQVGDHYDHDWIMHISL